MLEFIILAKHWFFRYLTSLTVVISAIVLALAVTSASSIDWKLLITAVSVGLPLIYFVQKQRLEELKLFTELFASFNKRYDELNDDLARIAELDPSVQLAPADEATLVDYFNLCGEEYLYYKTGYIYPEVWMSWLLGMQQYYTKEHIGRFWRDELRSGSYYGLNPDLLESGIRQGHQVPDLAVAGGAASGSNVG